MPREYTLKELAAYVGYSINTLRMYYSYGILPEPARSTHHLRKTTRFFTKAEMDTIKTLLESIKYGDLVNYRRDRRKKDSYASVENACRE